ncbi:Phosphatidylinositol transfer protein (PITP) [Marasmius tenuissimus]|uniref:Phosphatidylinositol transfer protein (PITP) n=1 Tax=Marasmius tenuissimus TaxID=585030 RepID=A0ABR2ZTU0_9AGAR
MSNRVHEPLLPPKDIIPFSTPTLTSQQEQMQKEVQAHFSKDGYKIPGIEEEKGELLEEEKFWLSYECQLRYLRATKWKLAEAIKRLEATLKWRREYGVYTEVTASQVEPEAVTGKQVLFGYDVNGRPGYYMIPSRQNTEESPRQVQHVVWMLERCIDLMDANVESLALLINFADKGKNPSMTTARTVLSILQDHYPERLGKALIINVPFIVNMFFKVITPFIDPITVQKLKFNPNVVKDGLFTPDMVMKEWWGGDQDFEYTHEKYWPKLVEICEQRKTRWMENWRRLGGTVGISEVKYKSDTVQVPAADVEEKKAATAEAPVVTQPAI